MKRLHILTLLLVVAILLSGCGAQAPAATSTFAPAPAATPTPAPTVAAPTATSSTPAGKTISSNGIEFTIPTGLGTDAAGSIVPQVQSPDGNGGPGDHSAYVQFKLQGYPTWDPKPFIEAQLWVYDASDPDIQKNVTAIRATLAAPAAPLTISSMPSSFREGLAVMSSNLKILPFASGNGVRRLTAYSQAIIPLDNSALTYEYQGLTSDGKFFVIVNLPISAPGVGAIPMPQDASGYDAYVAQISKILADDETAGKFSPSIAALDGLVQSIKIDSAAVMLPAPLPTVEAVQQPTSAACQDQATFKGEENPRDNAQFAPKAPFIKQWSIYNTGTCTWDSGYGWTFVSGDQMGGTNQSLANAINVSNGVVAPGGPFATFSIDMVAPANPGTYTGYWELRNGSGGVVPLVGGVNNLLFVKIVVGGGGNAAVGAITNSAVRFVQEQGSGGICKAKTTYFVYLDITANGPTTAQYRIDATDDSGQVADGVFDTFNSPEVSDSMAFDAAGTKTVSLRLIGPYTYPEKVTIRARVNGKDLPAFTVSCQ
jgi:Ig-like domain from next to BRCA1 gene